MHWRKYLELYKIGVKKSSAYKLVTFASFGSTILYIILLIAVWTAISQSAELKGGLSRVISYIIVGQVINTATNTGIEQWYGDRIRKGTITNELKRPVSVLHQAYLHDMGWKSLDAITKSIPILLFGLILTPLELPGTVNFAAFVISIVLSFHLTHTLAQSTSMLVFWTKTDSGIRFTRLSIVSFLSGVTFPLYLLPEYLKDIFFFFPFHLIVDGPINVFLGNTTGKAIAELLFQQLIWIGVFILIAEILWLKAQKKLTVQGG